MRSSNEACLEGCYGTQVQYRATLLAQGLRVEDLKLARWFLDIVAPRYGGTLHSHALVIPAGNGQGGRSFTSLSALFHVEWPYVPLGDLLTALSTMGVITSPQQTAESAKSEEPCGYAFRLTADQAIPCSALGGWQDRACGRCAAHSRR